MKNIYFVSLYIILITFSQTYPQTKMVNLSYSGRYDSLLYDGAGNYYDETGDEVECPPGICFVKVYRVSGDVEALVLKCTLVDICGEIDTLVEQKRKKVIKGDKLKFGDYIITGNDGMIELELKDGSVIRIGPNSKMLVSSSISCDFSAGGIINLGKMWFDIKKLYGGGKYELKINPPGESYPINAIIGVRGTTFATDIVKDGDFMTIILKVYEGSVTFGQDMKSEANKKKAKDKDEQMKKLSEDYKNGKVTIEEYAIKMNKIQAGLKEITEITVNAGFESRMTSTDKPTDPVPIEANENNWFNDPVFNK
jgi:hypothetical protein